MRKSIIKCMRKPEPLSIPANTLLILALIIPGVTRIILLILGTILLSKSYDNHKKDPECDAKAIYYVGIIIIIIGFILVIS